MSEFTDAQHERKLKRLLDRMWAERDQGNDEKARALWQEFAAEINKRSPEKIRAMERNKGLI